MQGKKQFAAPRFNRRTLAQAGVGLGLAATAGFPSLRSAAAQDRTTIRYMFWGSLLEREEVAKAMAGFEEAHPSIKVELVYVPDDYQVRLNTLAAANDLPEVFKIGAAQGLEWGAQGIALNMAPHLGDLGERVPNTRYDYGDDGSIGLMSCVQTYVVYANKEIFAEDGLELPPVTGDAAWSWDQLVETAKLATKDRSGRNAADADFDGNNIQQFGFTFTRTIDGWYPYILSNGGDIFSEDGMSWRINEPEAVETFQRLQDLIYVHRVSPTPAQSEGLASVAQQLSTRRVAMAAGGQWNLLDIAQADVPLAIGVLPRIVEPKTLIGASATVINTETEYVDEALTLYSHLLDPANSLGLYTSGLWMPTDLNYYTDEELVASWIDNDVHPPEYRTAVMDYALNFAEPFPVRLKNYSAIQPRLEQLLDPIWAGNGSVQEVLDGVVEELSPMLEGWHST